MSSDLQALVDAAYAPATLRAYATAWRAWEAWTAQTGTTPALAVPADLARYLAARRDDGSSRSTLALAVAGVSWESRQRGLADPTKDNLVRQVWRGLRREMGGHQRQARALALEELRGLLGTCTDGLRGERDAALLAVGWWAALRRSELAELATSDVVREARGYVIHVRRSKTDQEGRGRTIALAQHPDPFVCPVRALASWERHVLGLAGPLFRCVRGVDAIGEGFTSGAIVSDVIRQRAVMANLALDRLSGHSLRHGWVLAATESGASAIEVAAVTGHKSLQSVKRYAQTDDAWRHGPVGLLTRAPR